MPVISIENLPEHLSDKLVIAEVRKWNQTIGYLVYNPKMDAYETILILKDPVTNEYYADISYTKSFEEAFNSMESHAEEEKAEFVTVAKPKVEKEENYKKIEWNLGRIRIYEEIVWHDSNSYRLRFYVSENETPRIMIEKMRESNALSMSVWIMNLRLYETILKLPLGVEILSELPKI